ncbi:MAG TPA: PP2C family protein-serine/threonine phosphatase [Terriglobia bacterium]|nr:PP2C family protein-serine/threonine phosphatase [Terriglobia bacterium]
MRDKIYLASFLLLAGLLLYLGRDLLAQSAWATWGVTFAGTSGAAVLGLAFYQVQHQLRASRRELALKEAELNFARQVQQALFPQRFPLNSGLEFSAVCVPAAGISGDYFDVLELPNGRLVLAIADISGKGLSAAILMSNVHAGLRILAQAGHEPAEICRQLNRHLSHFTEGHRFATLFYAEWSRPQRSLTYVNAGHTVPILVSGNGASRLECGGVPIGLLPCSTFQAGAVTLQPGDLVALYSDGITEAGVLEAEPFGESQLEALILAHRTRPLDEIQREILKAVRTWSGGEPEDDMTLLLVRATGAGEGTS